MDYLNFKIELSILKLFKNLLSGVNDGARTRDNRNHNPVLYQLSYNHHALCNQGLNFKL
jgi:hypothetical protein